MRFLPEDERAILGRLLPEIARVTKELAELDKTLAQQALADPRAMRLMTIPGISSIVASTVLSSIGDVSRFPTPDKLNSYFGLTPKIRQSGDRPARHGRISNRGMLPLEKCWLKLHGPQDRLRDLYVLSSSASKRNAEHRQPLSRQLGNWRL
jgi:transposase